MEAGGKSWERSGALIKVTARDDDGIAHLGVIADVIESTPENVKAVATLGERLVAGGAEAIVVPGGIGGPDAAAMAATLEALGNTGVPVFVNPGPAEPREAFDAALSHARSRHPGLVNLAETPQVEGDDFTLLALPGHYAARMVHPGACRWGERELGALAERAAGAPEPRFLVAYHPPRVGGSDGIDATPVAPMGSTALARWWGESGLRFGLFAGPAARAATASDEVGAAIAPDTWTSKLLLHGGRVDTIPAPEDSRSSAPAPVATLLEVKTEGAGHSVRFRPVSIATGAAPSEGAP